MLAPSCSHKISGAKILSSDQIKGQEIATIKVTFDSDNRLKSPVATLASSIQGEQPYIMELRNIIATSKNFYRRG